MSPSSYNRYYTTACGALAFCIILVVVNYFVSLKEVALRIQGETLFITPSRIDLGKTPSNALIETKVTVKNISSRTAVIESVSTTCGCLTTEKTPLKIPPKSSNELVLLARINGSNNYDQTISLIVNDKRTLRSYPIRVLAKPHFIDDESLSDTILRKQRPYKESIESVMID